MNGCGIFEHWTSAGGGDGTSLNFYDRRTKTWSRRGIDEGGNALHLAGTFADGTMVLASEPRKTDAGVVVQRITWSKQPDAKVRQLWESVHRRRQDVDRRLRRSLCATVRGALATGPKATGRSGDATPRERRKASQEERSNGDERRLVLISKKN